MYRCGNRAFCTIVMETGHYVVVVVMVGKSIMYRCRGEQSIMYCCGNTPSCTIVVGTGHYVLLSWEPGIVYCCHGNRALCTVVVHVADLRMMFSGRAKVHWTVHKGSGNSRRTVHYRAEEVYIDKTLLLFGSCEYTTIKVNTRSIYQHTLVCSIQRIWFHSGKLLNRKL